MVLLVQGAFPSWAVARAMGDMPMSMQMCSEGPERTLLLGDTGTGPSGGADCCDLCVAAPALAAPARQAVAQPIRYAVAVRPPPAVADAPSARARDPPRPPSQAPPQTV